MHDGVRQFVSDCAESKVGQLVFVAYLIYTISMIGYFYDHTGDLYPFRFYGERELFNLINAPQIAFVRSLRLLYVWDASKLSDAFAAIYIALPWWVYGHIFERIVKRIADTSPKGAKQEVGVLKPSNRDNGFQPPVDVGKRVVTLDQKPVLLSRTFRPAHTDKNKLAANFFS